LLVPQAFCFRLNDVHPVTGCAAIATLLRLAEVRRGRWNTIPPAARRSSETLSSPDWNIPSRYSFFETKTENGGRARPIAVIQSLELGKFVSRHCNDIQQFLSFTRNRSGQALKVFCRNVVFVTHLLRGGIASLSLAHQPQIPFRQNSKQEHNLSFAWQLSHP
jgi:hypothetical protein